MAAVANFFATPSDEENVVRQMLFLLILDPVVQRAVDNIDLTLELVTVIKIRQTSLQGLLASLLRDLLCHLLPVVRERRLRRQYRESKFPDRLAT